MHRDDLPELILASTSTYRRELLSRLALDFRCETPDCDETPLPNETPIELAQRLAHAKALSVAEKFPEAWVIGSDQVAAVGTRVLHKPLTHERAALQLAQISGQEVWFYTGMCLLHHARSEIWLDVVPYTVFMRTLQPHEIDAYLALEQPFDCAGSFKSEGLGVSLFARMAGDDPTALVGLPLIRLCLWLREAGFTIPPEKR